MESLRCRWDAEDCVPYAAPARGFLLHAAAVGQYEVGACVEVVEGQDVEGGIRRMRACPPISFSAASLTSGFRWTGVMVKRLCANYHVL